MTNPDEEEQTAPAEGPAPTEETPPADAAPAQPESLAETVTAPEAEAPAADAAPAATADSTDTGETAAASPAEPPRTRLAPGEGDGPPRGARRERRDRDDREERGGGGRYFGRRKVCSFCVDHAKAVDYKDPSKLRRFVSDRGRIEGRRRTGVCAKHQRWLAVALKRARHLALLPYSPEHIRSSGSFPSRR